MASDISVKLAVEGEATFKSAVKAANNQIKALDAELKNVVSSFDDTNSAEEKAAAQMEVLSQKADVQREKLEILTQQHDTAKARLDELGAALEETKSEFGENSAEAEKAARAYNNQASEVARLETEMANASASINETTRQMGELGSEADNAGGQLSIFGQVLSAELIATAAIDGAKALAGALKDLVTDAVDYGDEIDKMSQKMGMSAQGYQEWDQVMQHCGSSMSTLKTSMKTLATAAETGNDAFGKLGISQREIAELDQEGLFNATIEALLEVEDTTERTYLAGKLLGRGATELGALLNMSAEDLKAMKDRTHELGAVLSNEAVKAAAHFKDAQQDLGAAIQGVTYEALAPMMEKIAAWADETATAIGKVRTAMNEPVTEEKQREIAGNLAEQARQYAALIEAGEATAAEVRTALEMFGTTNPEGLMAWAAAFNGAAVAADEFGGSAGGAFGEAAAGEEELAEGAEAAAGSEKVLDEATKAAADAAIAAREAYKSLCDDLRGMPEIVSMTGMSVGELADLLTGAGMSAQEFASGVSSARESIVNDFEKISEGSQLTGQQIVENLQANNQAQAEWSSNMRTLWAQSFGDEGMGGTVRAFLSYLAQKGPEFATAVADFANGGYETLQAAAAEWGQSGQQAGQDYADGVAMAEYVAQESGQALASGAATGMDGAAGDMQAAGEGAANEAMDGFGGVDGTPSGEELAGEFEAGITGKTGDVATAAENAANEAALAFDSVDGTPSGEAFAAEIQAGITGKAGDIAGAAESAAQEAAEAAKIDTTDVGEYLMSGIASGIANGRSGVVNAAREAVQAAVDAAKAAAQIASPSKVMRDEVGKFLTEGIAVGMLDAGALQSLESSADELTSALANWFRVDMESAESEVTSAVADWAKAWQDSLTETLRIGEHAIDMLGWHKADSREIVAEYRRLQNELHKQAEGYRAAGLSETSKYIQDLETKWWNYEKQIQDIEEKAEKERLEAEREAHKAEIEAAEAFQETWDKALDNFADSYQDAFNDLMKQQEAMQKKLSSYGELFHLTGTTVSLANLDSQTKAIERYGAVLEKLEARGVNGSLLEEILGLDMNSATLYGEKLMQMSNWEWDKYMDAYQRKQDAAASVAEKFYAEEYDKLNSEFIEKIPEAVAGLGQELSGLGVEAADVITESFASQQDAIAQSFADVLSAAITAAGGSIAGSVDLGNIAANIQSQGGAIASVPEREQLTVTELQTVMSGVVNGISSLMDSHMNQGESELSVTIDGAPLAQIMLPYLIASARANGTPIVNEG